MIVDRTDFHPPCRYGRATPGDQGQSGTDPGDFQEATLRGLLHGGPALSPAPGPHLASASSFPNSFFFFLVARRVTKLGSSAASLNSCLRFATDASFQRFAERRFRFLGLAELHPRAGQVVEHGRVWLRVDADVAKRRPVVQVFAEEGQQPPLVLFLAAIRPFVFDAGAAASPSRCCRTGPARRAGASLRATSGGPRWFPSCRRRAVARARFGRLPWRSGGRSYGGFRGRCRRRSLCCAVRPTIPNAAPRGCT